MILLQQTKIKYITPNRIQILYISSKLYIYIHAYCIDHIHSPKLILERRSFRTLRVGSSFFPRIAVITEGFSHESCWFIPWKKKRNYPRIAKDYFKQGHEIRITFMNPPLLFMKIQIVGFGTPTLLGSSVSTLAYLLCIPTQLGWSWWEVDDSELQRVAFSVHLYNWQSF